uniref:Uncharacterized protein n=1 Tax=Arundo donax TaxID=35708 RepID=A0A0A9B6Z0_ARUDO
MARRWRNRSHKSWMNYSTVTDHILDYHIHFFWFTKAEICIVVFFLCHLCLPLLQVFR